MGKVVDFNRGTPEKRPLSVNEKRAQMIRAVGDSPEVIMAINLVPDEKLDKVYDCAMAAYSGILDKLAASQDAFMQVVKSYVEKNHDTFIIHGAIDYLQSLFPEIPKRSNNKLEDTYVYYLEKEIQLAIMHAIGDGMR